jgi:hypothetical protein
MRELIDNVRRLEAGTMMTTIVEVLHPAATLLVAIASAHLAVALLQSMITTAEMAMGGAVLHAASILHVGMMTLMEIPEVPLLRLDVATRIRTLEVLLPATRMLGLGVLPVVEAAMATVVAMVRAVVMRIVDGTDFALLPPTVKTQRHPWLFWEAQSNSDKQPISGFYLLG